MSCERARCTRKLSTRVCVGYLPGAVTLPHRLFATDVHGVEHSFTGRWKADAVAMLRPLRVHLRQNAWCCSAVVALTDTGIVTETGIQRGER